MSKPFALLDMSEDEPFEVIKRGIPVKLPPREPGRLFEHTGGLLDDADYAEMDAREYYMEDADDDDDEPPGPAALDMWLGMSDDHDEAEDPLTTGETPAPIAPAIVLTENHDEVCTLAEGILSQDPTLFSRNGAWVRITRESLPGKSLITYATGAPRIGHVPQSGVERALCGAMVFVKYAKRTKDYADAHPPTWLSRMISDSPPGSARPLVGIAETPILRADGSVWDAAGYDDETGYYYAPDEAMARVSIPDRPTLADAMRSAEKLLALVADFPFAADCDRAAWIAALLTAIARPVIDGPVPLFLIVANMAGSGKTKLADLIGAIVGGRAMPRVAWPNEDDEMRKSLLAIALDASRFVLFDNLPNGLAVGSANLDAAITSRTIQGRILGKSEMSAAIGFDAVVFATGNNLSTRADTLRRVVPIRLETDCEHPEQRSDFQVEGDLVQHALDHRAELVAAALTILSAYLQAGAPQHGLTPMDFAAWSRIARGATYWALGVDPAGGRESMSATDETKAEASSLIVGLAELLAAARSDGLKTSDIIRAVRETPDRFTLEHVLRGLNQRGDFPTAIALGKVLQRHEKRVIAGKKLVSHVLRGSRVWEVADVK